MSDIVSLIDVKLDEEQARVVRLPPGRAALVLGEAGHGKTTVAIHRLAHLEHAARGTFRAAVIVPSEGLRALVERALVRLGVDAPALTFDRFARRQARRAFDDLPRRESADATPATTRLKRDPALAKAISAIAATPPGVIDDDIEQPRGVDGPNAVLADLQHLFGDRRLLEAVVREAQGRLPAHAVEETLEHTRVQFNATTEDEWSHVEDRRRLLAVDRKSIDEGTPTADAATIDVEDYAVLFAIDRARARRQRSRPRRGRRYDCLVVDEVQELAPIELALIARSLRPGGTLVVAGDENQRIDPGATFLGWPETMRALRRPDYAHVVLDVSYRCPPEVVALARHALGQVTLERPRLPLTQFDALPALVVWLARHAGGLLDADPNATIGVFTRSPLAARRIADDLARAIPVRLVWGGDFRFAPGVDVTTIDQVRGLEFDHVVIADGSSRTYGDDSASRRALYVAVTRAKKTVRLASVGVPTVIFAPS